MLDKDQNAEAGEREPVPASGGGGDAREIERQENEGGPAPKEEGQAEGDEGAAETQPEAEGEVDQPEADKPELPKWVQRRIDELTRQRHEEARRAAAAEEKLARFNQKPDDHGTQEQAEETVRQQRPDLNAEEVRAAALQLREQERFNEACNASFDAGVKAFPDFEKTIDKIRTNLGPLQPDFLADVLEAGNAHATLHHLGRNLEEADRIMSMPPRGRAIALARLSDKLSAPPPPKPVSKAPAPIDPVSGSGRPSALNTDPDSLSTEEWMRRRNAGEIR